MVSHPLNAHIKNGLIARLLIRASRSPNQPLNRFFFIILGCELGRSLPENTFLPHPQGIVLGSRVKLGNNVIIGHQVTLGGKDLEIDNMPTIEDGVYLGAGCKVLGKLTVGRGATVGANAVVTRNVPAGCVVVGANRILTGKKSAYSC